MLQLLTAAVVVIFAIWIIYLFYALLSVSCGGEDASCFTLCMRNRHSLSKSFCKIFKSLASCKSEGLVYEQFC